MGVFKIIILLYLGGILICGLYHAINTEPKMISDYRCPITFSERFVSFLQGLWVGVYFPFLFIIMFTLAITTNMIFDANGD